MSALSETKGLVFGFITEAEARVTNIVEVFENVATETTTGLITAFQTLAVGLIRTSSILAKQFVKSAFTVVKASAETVLGTNGK